MANEKYKVFDIIAALKEAEGMVNVAANMIGCAEQTIYNYAHRYPIIRETIDAELVPRWTRTPATVARNEICDCGREAICKVDVYVGDPFGFEFRRVGLPLCNDCRKIELEIERILRIRKKHGKGDKANG